MNNYGYWVMGLALVYTALLIGISRYARRKAAGANEGFFSGGRQFTPILVAVCITGLFSGSTFIAVLELSYLYGISAAWYGVAETIQVLLIAFVLLTPFRKRALVTISGLIGDHYGRPARAVAGAITAFSFPMWSVATALAFASAVNFSTGIPMEGSLVITAILLLVYLQSGGMWSIGFTQSMNCIVCVLMMVIALYAVFAGTGIEGLTKLAETRPGFYSITNVGMTQIAAWLGTFIINVPLAQAALQMSSSCRTPEEGRKGLILASIFGIPFILIATLLGMAAAATLPPSGKGLIAIPQYLVAILPAPIVGLFFVGIWACALGWAAPCQFSGATSLGRDVMMAVRPKSSEQDFIRYTRWALVLLTILMVLFGLLRSEQSAWWNILAWTSRNSATFGPVVAIWLFWRGATKTAVLLSMILGWAAGLGWYQLSGWGIGKFLYGIHPVWMGMSANLVVLVVASLITNGSSLSYSSGTKGLWGAVSFILGVIFLLLTLVYWLPMQPTGLLGLLLFLGALASCLGIMLALNTKDVAISSRAKTLPVESAG